MSSSQPLIFRKGLDMKEAVAGELAAAYDSAIVDRVRTNGFRYDSGRLTVHLARAHSAIHRNRSGSKTLTTLRIRHTVLFGDIGIGKQLMRIEKMYCNGSSNFGRKLHKE